MLWMPEVRFYIKSMQLSFQFASKNVRHTRISDSFNPVGVAVSLTARRSLIIA